MTALKTDTPRPGRGPTSPGVVVPRLAAPRTAAEVPAVAIARFMAAGLAAAILIAGLGVYLVRRTATREAVRDAHDLASVEGRELAAPVVEEALLAGDAGAIAAVDRVTRGRILSARVVRVKIWATDGRIVYSDERRLIGARYELGDDERAAALRGTSDAHVSNLDEPENRFERRYGKLLEIYVGIRTPSGRPLLFEEYLRFSSVAASGRRLWMTYAPAVLGGLVLLWLVQIPLAWSLTKRLRDGERQREALLRRAIETSDRERRRVAADLHDGVVQGLAGASYSLAAAAAEAERAGLRRVARTARQATTDLRRWIRELRTVLVAIAPPRLHDEGLAAGLADLASSLDNRGINVDVHVDDVDVPADVEALVFRVAQEAVRNVISHARADHVAISWRRRRGRPVLEVIDDGRGFDPADVVGSEPGHMGLRLLADLAGDAGAVLRLSSHPGTGTAVVLDIEPR